MTFSRYVVALTSGIVAIRGHALLNDLDLDQPKWWLVCTVFVVALNVFIRSVGERKPDA